jgi:hypothetical protein
MMTYNDILLPGLVGSNPLGAMAAFGLLRVCSEISGLTGARLYWTWDQDWRAVLSTQQIVGREELIEQLVLHQKGRSLSVFNWGDDIKINPEEYRELMRSHIINSSLYHRLDADYFAAYGSEMVKDKTSKGNVKPTALHMTAGQQKFLKLINKDLAKSMSKKTAEAYGEALFGPWKREDNVNSLGWDPSAKRFHALRHRSPSSDVFHCVRAAVWLAVEALPLYPTAAISGKLQTTGFTADRPVMFRWPIWKPPLGLDALRTLIMTSDSAKSLLRRGVMAIYRSERAESSQGGAFLRPGAE